MEKITNIFAHPYKFHALALFAAMLLTASAYVLEHHFGALPCRMCWWQRYAHWALGFMAFSGFYTGWIARGRRYAWPVSVYKYMLVVSVAGLMVAVWQSLGQMGVVALPHFCEGSLTLATDVTAFMAQLKNPQTLVAPACSEVNFRIFSLSLAQWNSLVMAAFTAAIAAAWAYARRHSL